MMHRLKGSMNFCLPGSSKKLFIKGSFTIGLYDFDFRIIRAEGRPAEESGRRSGMVGNGKGKEKRRKDSNDI